MDAWNASRLLSRDLGIYGLPPRLRAPNSADSTFMTCFSATLSPNDYPTSLSGTSIPARFAGS
jgi:hypothetical protein